MLELIIQEFEGLEELSKDATIEVASWKFILVHENDKLFFYASPTTYDTSLDHKQIAKDKKLNESKILGGGKIDYVSDKCKHDWRFYDKSDYGIVPNKVMKEIAIKFHKDYKNKLKFNSISIKMFYPRPTLLLSYKDNMKRWEDLGYHFDTNGIVMQFGNKSK